MHEFCLYNIYIQSIYLTTLYIIQLILQKETMCYKKSWPTLKTKIFMYLLKSVHTFWKCSCISFKVFACLKTCSWYN